MDKKELQKRVHEEEDFIRHPKCMNSLKRFMEKERHSDGVKDGMIAKLLLITEKEVEEIYQDAVKRLKKAVTDDSKD